MLIQEMKRIYNWLADEESKKIFLNRFLYAVTSEQKYLKNFGAMSQIDDEKALVERLCNCKQPIVLYGAGGMGIEVLQIAQRNQIRIGRFWDQDECKQGAGVCGIPIQAPGSGYCGDMVVVTPKFHTDEIVSNLCSMGIPERNIMVVRYRDVVMDSNQYFDENIISLTDNEVFVDGGCYDFSTAKIFLEKVPSAKRIYAFEPDEHQWPVIESAMRNSQFTGSRLIKKGLWNKSGTLPFSPAYGGGSSINVKGVSNVPVTSIDEIIDEPITFIKLDIEGAEIKALRGAQNHIVNEKPKLAICVYHQPQDIIEIPSYIKNLVPEYSLYLRHYSNVEFETVMYAVI